MFAFLSGARRDKPTLHTTLEGRALSIALSDAAQRALAERTTPLVAEMELYFSCLLRLQVRFSDAAGELAATPVTENLSIRFRPVMSRVCAVHSVEGAPPLDDFPIVKRAPFVPHWLRIDFKKGQWVGEFGYCEPAH
jgi:hypothetical protein